MTGRPLARAPESEFNTGFDYVRPVGSGLVLGLLGNVSYNSGYYANPTDEPASWQKQYWLGDATIKVSDENEDWEVALIGRNLGNELYFTRANDVTFTGKGTGTMAGVLADVSASISRGREVWLKLSLKPDALLSK